MGSCVVCVMTWGKCAVGVGGRLGRRGGWSLTALRQKVTSTTGGRQIAGRCSIVGSIGGVGFSCFVLVVTTVRLGLKLPLRRSAAEC